MAVGQWLNGYVDTTGDADLFKLDLVGGTEYAVSMSTVNGGLSASSGFEIFIIDDDAILIPCLTELCIGHLLGGFGQHGVAKKCHSQNDRRYAEQYQKTPVEAVGFSRRTVGIAGGLSGIR